MTKKTPDTGHLREIEELELLAAFIDGRLEGEERAKVQASLDRDSDLYDLYLDVVRAQEAESGLKEQEAQTDKVLEMANRASPVPPRSRWKPPAALAAGLVGALALMLWSVVSSGDGLGTRALAKLVTSQADGAVLNTNHRLPWTKRAKPKLSDLRKVSEEARSFRLGREMVLLRLAIAAGEAEDGRKSCSRISVFLDSLEMSGMAISLSRYCDENLETTAFKGRKSMRFLQEVEEEALNFPSVQADYFRLGAWTEAAWLTVGVAPDEEGRRNLVRRGRELASRAQLVGLREDILGLAVQLEQRNSAEELKELQPLIYGLLQRGGR